MTNCIILDGNLMCDKNSIFEYICKQLDHNGIYCKNIDGLHDILSEKRVDITLVNSTVMLNALKAYGCKILKCFYDWSSESGNIFILK